ncbi:hypothetical protein [Desulfurobacterium atlanticum]|uniref:Uncharacterized protein n=1 Tax=Desulfurobacterium atlanticum TaxID=240169 RepID=A0A238YS04_9BACT|nr:hypothetical protein [Desulfurobacterium atlanticum]SNR73800.1 hypothetical protein SAMN06265340_104142 [Desulfurobacterium atlanticum]
MDITEEISIALKNKQKLLSAFNKYLPYEKGFVLRKTAELLPEIQEIPDFPKQLSKTLNCSLQQAILVIWYFAFLVAIRRYEIELKKAEYDGDSRLAQLKDERFLRLARGFLNEVKSRAGRKPKKREKLEKLKAEILTLRKEGAGCVAISEFLRKHHKLKVSKSYIHRLLKEWE